MSGRRRDRARRGAFRAAAAGLALAGAALAGLAVLPGDSRPAGGGPARRDTFPAGTARGIAARACVLCHSPMLATQQAKDSSGWEATLAAMESWGALLGASEHDSLRDYLLENFGPRKAPPRR